MQSTVAVEMRLRRILHWTIFFFLFCQRTLKQTQQPILRKIKPYQSAIPVLFFLRAIERSTTLSNFIAVTLCCHHWILQNVR